MAHLALTRDPDIDRRRCFLAASRRRLESLSNLSVESFELDDLGVIWACGERTPSSVSRRVDGLRLLIGYAVDEAGQWRDADGLAESPVTDVARADVGDGYFAAVAYSRRTGLSLAVDPIGMFPMYWSHHAGILTAATSAELISAHPLFDLHIDRQGLAGILLTNGLLNDRSLFRHIRRLQPGYRLLASPAQAPIEQRVHAWQRDDSFSELPFDEACELVSHELRRAIRRHQPANADTTLLLSGGMDSRLMAGYLQQDQVTSSALCFGERHDYELRAAQMVSQSLNMPLYVDSYESDDAELCDEALEMARWQHLAGGFGCIHSWTNNNADYRKPEFFWSGYLLDELIGGVTLTTGRDPESGEWSFDFFQGRINRWGLATEPLKQLLGFPRDSSLLDAMISQWQSEYQQSDLTPSQCAFAAKMRSRPRFHIGTHLHRMAFQSWPLLPMLDRRLLHILFNLNPQWLLKRRLESELLQRNFPQLAEIPFDTNSFRFFPRYINKGVNIPSSTLRARQWLQKSSHRWYWLHWKKTEPRRYHRLYDLNSSLWDPVRSLAESQRSAMHEMFDAASFDSLLPQPDKKIPFKDPFSEGAPRRTLLGLMLWQAAHDSTNHGADRLMAVA